MNNWISVTDRVPELLKGEIARDFVLYVIDGDVFSGYYHENGCFYPYEKHGKPGRTDVALRKYHLYQLPFFVVTHWMPYPEFNKNECVK